MNARHSLRSRRVVERGVTIGASVPTPIQAKWPVVVILSPTPTSVSSAPMPNRSTLTRRHFIPSDAIHFCRIRRVHVETNALTRIVFLSTGCIRLGPFRPSNDGTVVACVLRYKTEFCSRGRQCTRPFCFFAHSEAEMRPVDTKALLAVSMSPQVNAETTKTAPTLSNAPPPQSLAPAYLPFDDTVIRTADWLRVSHTFI